MINVCVLIYRDSLNILVVYGRCTVTFGRLCIISNFRTVAMFVVVAIQKCLSVYVYGA